MNLGGLSCASGSGPTNIRSFVCWMQIVPSFRWKTLAGWKHNAAGTQPEEPTRQDALQWRPPGMPASSASFDCEFSWRPAPVS